MSRIVIGPVLPDHVEHVANHMREADRAEIWASSRSHPLDGLSRSVVRSDRAWTGMLDGEPTAIFGIGSASVLCGVGVPWMLGTDRMGFAVPAVLRASRQAVEELGARYPVMRNCIDERNIVSKRWLAWLGFTFSEPFPHGPDRLPFRMFEKVT